MNKELIALYKKRYRDKNRLRLNELSRLYTKLNPRKRRLAKRKWAIKNSVYKSVLNRNWNAKKSGAEGSFSYEEYKKKVEEFNSKCAYCLVGDCYTIDHVVPTSRGGTNFINNIVPACLRCNSQKRNRTIEEWSLLPNCYNKNKHLL